jgi:hypothetical protein
MHTVTGTGMLRACRRRSHFGQSASILATAPSVQAFREVRYPRVTIVLKVETEIVGEKLETVFHGPLLPVRPCQRQRKIISYSLSFSPEKPYPESSFSTCGRRCPS